VLVAKYSVDDQIGKRRIFRKAPNWESFCIYDSANPSEPGVIFEGATKLPDNTQEFMWQGLQHWCGLLSEIRSVLPTAIWRVNVDDHEIAWDEASQAYDPTR
jgi:hypothetical protein